jgi:site-specific recombinase
MGSASHVQGSLPPASGETTVSPSAKAELRKKTEAFCAADSSLAQTRCLIELSARIWLQPSDRKFRLALIGWVGLLEQDHDLRSRFQTAWKSMLGSLDCVSLLAEAGLPARHALLPEVTHRLFQRLLPATREDADAMRLFVAIFGSPRSVDRFVNMDAAVFTRLAAILWDERGFAAFPSVREDLDQALRLLAARVSARGTSVAVRERSARVRVEQSPFYAFVFATEKFIGSEGSEIPGARMERWLDSVYACRGELALVRLNMEDAGVSAALVFDLGAMDAALDRMELLAAALAGVTRANTSPERLLLNTLANAVLEDTRIFSLIRQNFNLLARKTVERTGHGGEHYIAHTRKDYWRMWGAAIGGGFLTVFTAAIKLHIIGTAWPPFIEAVLVGTDYAISFLLLQMFGLALATKQPSMTAATLANIIRRNRGDSRRDKIVDFTATITRTQLAAALGNILAVCSGAVVFNLLWRVIFGTSYLPADQAERVYHSLSPLHSATTIDAALTGVLLWMAGLIGGWCENFAVYNRIPASIAQHPLGRKFGIQRMEEIADWFHHNIAAWSTSISLGYLMGFTPVIAEFFGLPLNVRHVTLNTGMFAFAAASYGWPAFGQLWLYSAIVGIAIMFVMNLGVSFSIASSVALRAYDVPRKERVAILRYTGKQILQSPLRFLLPIEPRPANAKHPAELAGSPAAVPVEVPAKSVPVVTNPSA